MSNKNRRVVILGAGLTGLTAAHFLEKEGVKPFILEKKPVAGGLCRSEEKDGFLFDYTGHLLHFKGNKSRWKDFVEKDLGVPLKKHSRRAYIHILNRLVPYPFQYNLAFLPAAQRHRCVKDYLSAYKKFPPPEEGSPDEPSFYDWAVQSFGERMSRLFFLPYNKKLWRCNLKKMTTLWMGRFVPPPNMESIVRGAQNRTASRAEGYNANFYYPEKGGIGAVTDSLSGGRNIIFNSSIKFIDHLKKEIYFEGGKMSYDTLISTIPLPSLLGYLKKSPVSALAGKLKWVGVYNVNLVIRKNFSRLGHWIYFPHRKVPFYRIGFLSNFSSVPENYSSVYIETSYAGTKRRPGLKSILKFLKLDEGSVAVRKNLDIPFAYVVYDKEREKILPAIFDFFRKNGIFAAGRYGGWKYSTMEEALEDGYASARFAAEKS